MRLLLPNLLRNGLIFLSLGVITCAIITHSRTITFSPLYAQSSRRSVVSPLLSLRYDPRHQLEALPFTIPRPLCIWIPPGLGLFATLLPCLLPLCPLFTPPALISFPPLWVLGFPLPRCYCSLINGFCRFATFLASGGHLGVRQRSSDSLSHLCLYSFIPRIS